MAAKKKSDPVATLEKQIEKVSAQLDAARKKKIAAIQGSDRTDQ